LTDRYDLIYLAEEKVMKKCPNCGLVTLRTLDWACQWCAYPLMSRSYKKIDSTFRELYGERMSVPFVLAEPEQKPEPALEPVSEAGRISAPETLPEPEREQAIEPEPAMEAETKAEEIRKSEPEPELEPRVEPVSGPEPESRSETDQVIELGPASEAEPEAEQVRVPETEAEPGLTKLSVEDLYAALDGGVAAADARFRDKTLVLTGLVYRSIINENLDVAYVILTSTKKYGDWQVTCTFDKGHEGEIRRLRERDTITVKGKYDGYGATFLVRECTFVQ
jgi:hypothetical protein